MNTDPFIRVRRRNRGLLYSAGVCFGLAVFNGLAAWVWRRWFNLGVCLVLLAGAVYEFSAWLKAQARLQRAYREFKYRRRAHFMLMETLRREGIVCHVRRVRFSRHKKGSHAAIDTRSAGARNN